MYFSKKQRVDLPMKLSFKQRAYLALKGLRFPDRQDRIVRNQDACAVVRMSYDNPRNYWLNGYVALPLSRIPESDRHYDSPKWYGCGAHGGLTFAFEDEEQDIMIFGFDTAHYGDDEVPEFQDPDHILRMAKELRKKLLARL